MLYSNQIYTCLVKCWNFNLFANENAMIHFVILKMFVSAANGGIKTEKTKPRKFNLTKPSAERFVTDSVSSSNCPLTHIYIYTLNNNKWRALTRLTLRYAIKSWKNVRGVQLQHKLNLLMMRRRKVEEKMAMTKRE